MALLVVLGTVCSLFGFVFLQRLSKSIAAASSGINLNERVDLDGRFNLLLGRIDNFENPTSFVNELLILTVEPTSRKAGLYRLPIDLEVSNLGGFGQAKLSSIYGLSMISKVQDLNFIPRQIQEIFSLPIDGFLLIDNQGFGQMAEVLGSDLGFAKLTAGDYLYFLQRSVSLFSLSSRLRTNLGPLSLWSVFSKIISTRFNKFPINNLDEDYIKSTDQTFSESQLEQEGEKVIVLNGTRVPLLATKVARLITNMGGTVFEATNAPGEIYPKSVIIARDRESRTLKRLSRALAIEDIRPPDSFEDDPNTSPFLRVDLVVILGLDYVSPN